MKYSLILTCLALSLTGALLGCGGGTPGGGEGTPTPAPTATPTPGGGSGVPAAPTSFSASASGTGASLAWTDNANNETGYTIQKNPSGTGWSDIQTIAANATSATVTGLENETGYQFRVVAVNASGASAPSNEASARTAGVNQPTFVPTAPFAPRYASLLTERIIWPTRTLTYSIDTSGDPRDPALLVAAVQKAFQRWGLGTNNLLTFTKVDSGASIPIHFAPASDPDLIGGEGAGAANYSYTPGTPRSTFISTDIKLRTGLSEGQLVAVAAHEIGHALGITGHSDTASDIMFPVTDPSLPISQRDASTLAFLYLTTDAS